MRQTTRKSLERREKVHEIALDIIREQGYVVAHDVADRLGVSLRSAAITLATRAHSWNLASYYTRPTVCGYSAGGLLRIYTGRGNKQPPETLDISSYRPHKLQRYEPAAKDDH